MKDELFKGYVPTQNKKCTMRFKNASPDDLLSFEQVENRSEYAGILAEDIILIDIDDSEQSEILLSIVDDLGLACRVYETSRGMHFFFRNVSDSGDYYVESCRTGASLACGLEADIKLGCKNSYSVLKYDGIQRKILYDKDPDAEYDQLPKFLIPVRSKQRFMTMEAGSGRNQSLFNYILTLQGMDFSVEECRECIRIINKYVIKEPLDDQELDTILRDGAFQKQVFFKGGTFLHDRFGNFLKSSAHVSRVGQELCVYDDGIYVRGYRRIEHDMIKHIPNLTRSRRTEVLTWLEASLINSVPLSDARYICFKNGVLDVKTGELSEHSPDYVLLNKIPHDYDPEAYSEVCDRTLDKISCHDPEVRALLEEVAGYTMYRRNELRKAFILIGDKANGKSTFLDMINTMLGSANTTALDLKELSDRFKTAEAASKLAIIGDDIGDEFIPNPSIFKKLVSGDRINAERKGKDPFDFDNYSKLLFSANNIPRIKDKSGAVIDRLIIVPFRATFSPDDPDYDPNIKYKLRSEESIKYLIRIGINALSNVLERKRFTVSESMQKELKEYEENNNPVLLFFAEDPKIVDEPTRTVYRKYSEFCTMNGFQPISNIEFSKQVRKQYKMDIVVRKIRGTAYRVFVKREEDSNG